MPCVVQLHLTKSGLSSGAARPSGGPGAARCAPLSVRERRLKRLSVGELLKAGKYLEAMEKALYTRFLDKLDADDWDGCGQVVALLKGLTII